MTARLVVLALLSALVILPACGSDDEDGASAADVERSLRADLASGGDRVVDLDGTAPKEITCEKDPDRESGWRCTVKTGTGRSILCFVNADPESGEATRRVCAPVDN